MGVPPEPINFAGGGNFREIGEQQVDLLVSRARLSAEDRVMDVGCGIGRLALPLARRFPSLDYSGFDIVRYGVSWTRKTLREKPNFKLTHVDIRNSFYNPFGRVPAEQFVFPQTSDSLDLVFATSVFTHLTEASARNYLKEIGRCLSQGGRVYLTAFIVDDQAHSRAAFKFSNRIGLAYVASRSEPEMAVGYDIVGLQRMAHDAGLSICEIFRGSWRGDIVAHDFQDAILLSRS
ncbi:methyltransferase domain-containing protein [Paracoccus sp. Z118]|nr:methyltransferase domain-containing protein [Paracoccus sp. Z118]